MLNKNGNGYRLFDHDGRCVIILADEECDALKVFA